MKNEKFILPGYNAKLLQAQSFSVAVPQVTKAAPMYTWTPLLWMVVTTIALGHCFPLDANAVQQQKRYRWTTDHMHVGVRWQPFASRPDNNRYDAKRPVIAQHSSYAQFWVSWPATEPTPAHRDYLNNPTQYLRAIEAAVNECVAKGIKVEFVFMHCPGWAAVSGKTGGWKPKVNHFEAFVTAVATHFKGRVDAYQLAHESNLKTYFQDGDIDYLLAEVMIKGAKAIRVVYEAQPAIPVLISTSGCSPCQNCPVLPGLKGIGGKSVDNFYDQLISSQELMNSVDALNLNVSDHFDGYGNMDGKFVPSAWGNFDLLVKSCAEVPRRQRSSHPNPGSLGIRGSMPPTSRETVLKTNWMRTTRQSL